jgi:hypothetical protein
MICDWSFLFMADSAPDIGNPQTGTKTPYGAIDDQDLKLPEFIRSDETALHHVRARYRNMYDYKLRYTQRNNVHYEMYRGYNRPVTYPFHSTVRSNIHVPYAFATVEQVTPRIVRGCLNDGYNFFDLYPREKMDRTNAEQHKKLLKWQIEVMNFYIEFSMMVKTTAMFGYCCGKMDWIFQVGQKRHLRIKDKYMGQVIEEEVRAKYGHALYEEVTEENHIIYDNNRFTCMDWDEAYPDEAAKYTLHTGRDFIHQTKLTLRDLHERKRPDGKPLYKNLEKITMTQSYSQEDGDKDRRLSTIGATKESWRQHSQMKHNKAGVEVVLWEYWTPRFVVTVANQNQVIRREHNLFWHSKIPALDLNYTYVPNELFGIGAIESFRDLQTALNTITNMDLDNWSMTVNQMHVVDRRADIPQRQLVSRPHGVIYSSLPPRDSVMPLVKQSIAGETSLKQQEYRANIQLASGLSDMHYLGTSGGSRVGRTATGMQMAQEESNVRFEMQVALAEHQVLKPMLKMMASNNRQFMRTPKWVRIIGEAPESKPPELITPEDIWDEVDIIFYGAQRIAKKQTEQHQFINFLRSIGNVPMFLTHLKPRKFVREALRRFVTDDPEEYMVQEPGDIMTPAEENELLSWGQPVKPSMEENFQMHYEAHVQATLHPSYGAWPLEAQYAMEQHIAETLKLLQMAGASEYGAGMAAGTDPGQIQTGAGSQTREAAGMGNDAGGQSGLDTPGI